MVGLKDANAAKKDAPGDGSLHAQRLAQSPATGDQSKLARRLEKDADDDGKLREEPQES
jgi:hypothetical protein